MGPGAHPSEPAPTMPPLPQRMWFEGARLSWLQKGSLSEQDGGTVHLIQFSVFVNETGRVSLSGQVTDWSSPDGTPLLDGRLRTGALRGRVVLQRDGGNGGDAAPEVLPLNLTLTGVGRLESSHETHLDTWTSEHSYRVNTSRAERPATAHGTLGQASVQPSTVLGFEGSMSTWSEQRTRVGR